MDFNITTPWDPGYEGIEPTDGDPGLPAFQPGLATDALTGVLSRLSPQALGQATSVLSSGAPIDPFAADSLIDHSNALLANIKGPASIASAPSINPDQPATPVSVSSVWISPENSQRPWDLGSPPATVPAGPNPSFAPLSAGSDAGRVIPLGNTGSSPGSGIDWSFIERREHPGDPALTVQVPKDSNGVIVDNSGPTVGYGLDLGHQTPAGLLAIGVDPDLVDLVAPYTNRSGQAADDYVQAHPLTLTQDQVGSLDKAMEGYKEKQIAATFDASSKVGKFSDLPPRTQTAITDLFYQYNIDNPHGAPQFLKQMTTGDWPAAYNNLQNFGDHFPSRRHDEAALLQADIKADLLPKAAP